MTALALDANLLVLLLIGSTAPELVGKHKRLRAYNIRHYDALVTTLRGIDVLVATPNVLTEVANLAPQGIHEPLRARVMAGLANLIKTIDERYDPSQLAVVEHEFVWLGLADAASLMIVDRETIFLTDDGPLFKAALGRGLVAYHFSSSVAAPRVNF